MQPDYIFYGINGGPTALHQLPQPNINLFWLVGSGKAIVYLLSTKLRQNLGVIYDGNLKNDKTEICSINEIFATLIKSTDNEIVYDVWIHQRSYGLINVELAISGSTETSFTFKNVEKKYINVQCFGFLKFLPLKNNIFAIDHLDNICIINTMKDLNCEDGTIINLNRDKYGIPLVIKNINKKLFVIGTDGGYILFVDTTINEIVFVMKQEKISPIFGMDVFDNKIIVGTRSQKFWIGNIDEIINNTSNEITYSTIPSQIPSKLTNLIIEPNTGKFFVVTCTDGRFFFCKQSKNNQQIVRTLREINYSTSTISSISWENHANTSTFNLLVGLRDESKLCYWKFS